MKALTAFAGLCCALVSCLPLGGHCQVYFNNRYQLVQPYSLGVPILPLANGNYWLTGTCGLPNNQDGQGLFLQQLDAQGQVFGPLKQWTTPFVWHFPGVGGSLLARPNGELALVGTTSDTLRGNHGKLWLFSAQGDTLWTRDYYSPTPDNRVILRNGLVLPDGGFLLCGEEAYRDPQTTFFKNYLLLLRADATGNVRWRQTYQSGKYHSGHHPVTLPDGSFLLSGITWMTDAGGGPQDVQAYLLKVDSTGQQQWLSVFGGPYNDSGGPALPTPDGGYVMSGAIASYALNQESYGRAALFWLDSAGILQRQRTYGPLGRITENYALLRLPDGGLAFGGQQLDAADRVTGYMVRTCADGDSVWQRSYQNLLGAQSQNYLRDIHVTNDGGFVASGFLFVLPPDTGYSSAWVFKTDQYGYLQPGGSPPTVQCRPTGLAGELIMNNEKWAVWPNPSADGRFTLTPPPASAPIGRGSLTLTVTDALGRAVWRGAWETSPSTGGGRGEVVVDLSRCAPGLYLLRMTGPEGQTQTRKLVR